MNFYKLTLKNIPEYWEKYGIMNVNPELEKFKWFLTTALKPNKIIVETTDQDIMLFAVAHGADYRLERITLEECQALKHKQQAEDFLNAWKEKQRNQHEGFYDGNYNDYYE